ncbi:hypothetical protein MUS1_03105 [Marinomonas ushuaiensis DSM 15871]|uniref:Glycosyl transferase family 1 domain-containing protein n=1 Tax=Marinomonas ushuaiensis DSM 15871 TaxID=1122207 RepID=X7EA09_9GAMM|nr:glycosyltransferase family 4 protein [Marinomonas ushuaiensis]ETX12710.1 hypothetical protein MUS1_03105 [Marinomonas ushuaiensis DSM 15871]
MENKKKLLFWGELPPTVYHGISISNERILSALSTGFIIHTIEDKGSFGGRLIALFSFFISILKLMYVSYRKFDIYYTNMPMSYFGLWKIYLSIVCVKLISSNTKVVSHLHRGDFLDFIKIPRNKYLFKKISTHIDLVLSLSKTSKSELVSSGLINADKVEVLHNTISVTQSENTIRKNILNDFSQSDFYCLCNYISTKRIHHLVEIANAIPLVRMSFNGAAESDSYMQKLSALNTGAVCHFNGVINGEEKEVALSQSKALVLPSLNEGMPLVVLESLAQSTPVICYDVGYIGDYVGSDYPGLVKELTDKALKEKIEWMNNLPSEEYLALRKHSFDLFWNNFDLNKINCSALNMFKHLV